MWLYQKCHLSLLQAYSTYWHTKLYISPQFLQITTIVRGFICIVFFQLFQEEYADVLQEELEKCKKWDTSNLSSENMVDVNQNKIRTPHTVPRRKMTPIFQRENLNAEILRDKLKKRNVRKFEKEFENSSDDFEETPDFLKRAKYKKIDLASPMKGVKHYSAHRDIDKRDSNVKKVSQTPARRNIELLYKDSQDFNRSVLNKTTQTDSCGDFKQNGISDSEIKQLNDNLMHLIDDKIVIEPSKKIIKKLYNLDDVVDSVEDGNKTNNLQLIQQTPINYKLDKKLTSYSTPRRKPMKLFQKGNCQESVEEEILLQDDKLKKSLYGKLVKKVGSSSDDFEETPSFLKKRKDRDLVSQTKRVRNDYVTQDASELCVKKTEELKTPSRGESTKSKVAGGSKVNILSNIQISPAKHTITSYNDIKEHEMPTSRMERNESSKKVARRLYNLDDFIDSMEDGKTNSLHSIKQTPVNRKIDMKLTSHTTARCKSTRLPESSSDDFEETPSFLKQIKDKALTSQRKCVKNDSLRQDINVSKAKNPEMFKTPSRRSTKLRDVQDIKRSIVNDVQFSPAKQTDSFNDFKAIELSDFEIKQLDHNLMLLNCC